MLRWTLLTRTRSLATSALTQHRAQYGVTCNHHVTLTEVSKQKY